MTKKRKSSLMFVVSILILVSREAHGLTEKEALSKALALFPQMKIATLERDLTRFDNEVADGAFDLLLRGNSQLDLAGYYDTKAWDFSLVKPLKPFGSRAMLGYRRGFGLLPVYDEKLRTTSGGEMYLGLEFSLLRNRSIDQNRSILAKSKNNLETGNLILKTQELETLRITLNRYWDWITAVKRVEIQTNLLKLAEERDDALKKRVKLGDTPKIDQIDNERIILQRQSDLAGAQRALAKAKYDLLLYLSNQETQVELPEQPLFPDPSSFAITAESADLNLQAAIEHALSTHPDLKRLQIQSLNASVDLEQSKNLSLPRLDASITGSQDSKPGSSTLTPFSLETKLMLEIPIERNLIRGRVSQSQIQLDRIENQLILSKNRIEFLLREIHAQFKANKERFFLTKKESLLADQIARGERIRFQNGDSNLIFLNLREQTQAETKFKEVQAFTDLMKTRVDFYTGSNQINELL